jgi:hypothetical protein
MEGFLGLHEGEHGRGAMDNSWDSVIAPMEGWKVAEGRCARGDDSGVA